MRVNLNRKSNRCSIPELVFLQMNIQQIINCGERKQRNGKGKFGNSTPNHWIALIAVEVRLRYSANIQIESSRI
jgi:hypothetical protein